MRKFVQVSFSVLLLMVFSGYSTAFAQGYSGPAPTSSVLDQVVENVTNLAETVQVHAGHIDQVALKQNDDGARLAATQVTLREMRRQLWRLKNRKISENAALAECGRLREDLTALNNRLTALENAPRSDVSGILGSIATITGRLDGFEGRMTALESRVGALEVRMSETEGEVKALKAARNVVRPRVGVEVALSTSGHAGLGNVGARFVLSDSCSLAVGFGLGYGGQFANGDEEMSTIAMSGLVAVLYEISHDSGGSRFAVGPSVGWLGVYATEAVRGETFAPILEQLRLAARLEYGNSGFNLGLDLGYLLSWVIEDPDEHLDGFGGVLTVGYEW